VTIDDSVILGKNAGTGISATSSDLSLFRRALVAGFSDGMRLDTATLEVYDGTITKNTRGVTITGPQAGVHPGTGFTCPPVIQTSFTPPPPPPPVTTWRRDPVFVRCDIANNGEYAIKLHAPELLVVEESNIKGNGAGVIVEADSLHQDSRIVKSNVYGNGAGPVQIETFHQTGQLNISGNYWSKISDPELSASWGASHTRNVTCSATNCTSSNCGSSYSCASNYYNGQQGRTYWTSCTATVPATWSSPVSFTGFSPTELPAGPRKADLCDMVKEERSAQSL